MISNWDFSLVLAISELLVDPQQPSSLLDIKLHAFQKAKDLMLQYRSCSAYRCCLPAEPRQMCRQTFEP